LRDILLEGNRLTWAQSITKPMRLNLTFDVTIDGDQIHGTSKGRTSAQVHRQRSPHHPTESIRPQRLVSAPMGGR
jgi:hypothetical protein